METSLGDGEGDTGVYVTVDMELGFQGQGSTAPVWALHTYVLVEELNLKLPNE